MVKEKGVPSGLESRVTIPEDSSRQLVPESSGPVHRAWLGLLSLVLGLGSKAHKLFEKVWTLGSDDTRKVIHCFKVGLALTVVSLFYYIRPLYNGVGGTAMWAVMTVVVVFEYSVGATLGKGLNRAMGTLLAGALALGIHSFATNFGNNGEQIILGASLFFLASAATFSRFLPTVKTRYDYGVSIFILMYSLVSVSGYRVENLLELAHERLTTIAIGSSMCLLISMLVCPVWAGEDLHLLVTCNMEKLADSLHGFINEYFSDNESVSNDEEPSPQLQGYKCVLNSKSTEESLANFARWEPSHGSFGFRHPWKQYLKIGTLTRDCAYCVEALNGCINSEVQAPDFLRKHMSTVCMRLTSLSSEVLKELASTTKIMTKSSNIDFLLGEMNKAVEDLHNTLKILPNQFTTTTAAGETEREKMQQPITEANLPLMEVLPLVSMAYLLIETTARIESIVVAVEELGLLADFKTRH